MTPCRCSAYKFPHRPGGGNCTGGKYRCCACEVYTDDYEEHVVSGRVGHIDNWLPDEVITVCPNCGADEMERV